MTSSSLTPFQGNWCRRRRTQYLRAGAIASRAESASLLEAIWRQGIERTAGRRAALVAEFGFILSCGGGQKLGFLIDPNLIDPPDRDTAYTGLGAPSVGLPSAFIIPVRA